MTLPFAVELNRLEWRFIIVFQREYEAVQTPWVIQPARAPIPSDDEGANRDDIIRRATLR